MSAIADLEKDKFDSEGRVKVSGDFAVSGQTEYTSADILALGASTDMSDWLGAYEDGMLTYKYVEDWEGTNEKIVYLTHPSLGDGYKCLRLFYIYTTQATETVVESVNASVVNWTYDDEVRGTISLTLGTVTSPAANALAGTDVCTVTITNTGSGSNTLSLSGTNASLYQLNNTTQAQTGSTLTNVLTTDTVVVETASDFANVTYSHSLTVTLTENNFNQTASQNISTSGTEVVAGFSSEFCLDSNLAYNYQRVEFSNSSNVLDLSATSAFTISFWIKTDSTATQLYTLIGQNTASPNFMLGGYANSTNNILRLSWGGGSSYRAYNLTTASMHTEWTHVVVRHDGTGANNPVININGGSDNTGYSGTLIVSTNSQTEPYFLGGNPSGDTNFTYAALFSQIDLFAVFDTNLSDSDALALYNSGNAIDPSDVNSANLVRLLNFEDSNDLGYDSINQTSYTVHDTNGDLSQVQLTMDDAPYYSASGNHKYISDACRGAVLGSDLVGNYYRDSSSDYKGFFPDLDSATGFRTSNNVSYSFWTKFNYTSGTPALFQEHYVLSATRQSFTAVYLTSSQMLVYAAHNNSNRFRYITYPTDGNWHHVVITTTSSDIASGGTIYIDGVVVSSAVSGSTQASIVRDQPVDAINFGGTMYNRASSQGTYSTGGVLTFIMDEFSTWKKTLSASEVSELWNSGSPTDLTQHSASADLQRWFRFGDTTGDGTAIKDSQETSVELISFDSQDNTQNH